MRFDIADPSFYVFLSLLIVLIFYLIRPKPKEKTIPSLMFFMDRKKKSKLNAFFRKLFRDPLMIFHLIIIALICFAFLLPFVSYDKEVTAGHTVMVMDVSASMEGNMNEMIKDAKGDVEGRTSVVLARDYPSRYIINESSEKAKKRISDISPTHMGTDLISALEEAKSLSGENGRIIVYSDFQSKGDVVGNINLMDSDGFEVGVRSYNNDENVGFIDYEYDNDVLDLYLKNFGEESKTVTVNENSLEIRPDSVEKISLEPEKGKRKIVIEEKDDIPADDEFYINIPVDRKLDVLLLTNDKDTYLYDFFSSSPSIDLDVVSPPSFPGIDHDVVVIDSVKESYLLTKIKDSIKAYVQEGGALVVTQKLMEDFLPVSFEAGRVDKSTAEVEMDTSITRDLVFPRIKDFRKTSPSDSSATIVSASGNPVISYWSQGDGKVMYYGIPEENNEFRITAGFPLFWHRSLKFLSSFNDFDKLNRETGEYETTGFHDDVAVNLLDSEESKVGGKDIEKEIGGLKGLSTEEREFNLNLVVIPLTIIFMISEIIFLRRRGDL
ncbi:MAG: DUF7408 domain-containing protein [Nanobdellota archaeon]